MRSLVRSPNGRCRHPVIHQYLGPYQLPLRHHERQTRRTNSSGNRKRQGGRLATTSNHDPQRIAREGRHARGSGGASSKRARAATSGAALGVHAGNIQWGWSGSLDNYSSPVNRKPSLINVFQAFYYNGGLRHVSLSGLNTLQNRYPGSVIMLTLEPRGGPVTLDSIRTYAVERERLVAEVSIGSENISSRLYSGPS